MCGFVGFIVVEEKVHKVQYRKLISFHVMGLPPRSVTAHLTSLIHSP